MRSLKWANVKQNYSKYGYNVTNVAYNFKKSVFCGKIQNIMFI